MRFVLLFFVLWAGGSWLTYHFLGTDAILPYAGITILAVVLAILAANRRQRRLNQSAGPR